MSNTNSLQFFGKMITQFKCFSCITPEEVKETHVQRTIASYLELLFENANRERNISKSFYHQINYF
jgi:hypothetical protein